MTVAIIAGMIAVVVVLVIVTRNSSRVKKEAREDLQRELESLPHRDIMDLVMEEAAETGVETIPGGDGVDLPVRLRVWHRDAAVREACPDPALLRFVVAPGVDPERAEENDVRLTFPDHVPAPDAEPDPGEPVADEPEAGEDDATEPGAEV